MRVTPISEQEADALSTNLWPDNEYDYEIKEAEEKTSRAGNDMFALQIWLYDDQGAKKMVFDYLINEERQSWKIRHFAASCGLLPQYEKGSLMVGEMIGRTGRCTIGSQPAKDGYPAKNVVRGYVKATGATPVTARPPAQREKAPAGDIDDEIPF